MWFRDFKKNKPDCFALRALIGPAFSFSTAKRAASSTSRPRRPPQRLAPQKRGRLRLGFQGDERRHSCLRCESRASQTTPMRPQEMQGQDPMRSDRPRLDSVPPETATARPRARCRIETRMPSRSAKRSGRRCYAQQTPSGNRSATAAKLRTVAAPAMETIDHGRSAGS